MRGLTSTLRRGPSTVAAPTPLLCIITLCESPGSVLLDTTDDQGDGYDPVRVCSRHATLLITRFPAAYVERSGLTVEVPREVEL